MEGELKRGALRLAFAAALTILPIMTIAQTKGDPPGGPATPGCVRRVSSTGWAKSNPLGWIAMTPPVRAYWNDVDACVEDGALLMFRDGFGPEEYIAVWQWRHAPAESNSQAWGFDIGAVRLVKAEAGYRLDVFHEGADPSALKNEDAVIYGKPVYAMTSGWIVRCWRNAPENSMPPAINRQENRIPGSGNYVVIEEPDGDRIWYAHGQTGTVPASLCPNNAALFTSPSSDSIALQDPEADVPVGRRTWVNAGDFLFLVGNSGESSGPHLHVHKHRARPGGGVDPVAIGFAGYAYSQQVALPRWTAVLGEPWPPGPFLIQPPGGGAASPGTVSAVPAARPPITPIPATGDRWRNGMARYGRNIGDRIDLVSPDPGLCEAECLRNPDCRSWTYVRPGYQAPQAVCWIKSDAPEPIPDDCCSTGEVPG